MRIEIIDSMSFKLIPEGYAEKFWLATFLKDSLHNKKEKLGTRNCEGNFDSSERNNTTGDIWYSKQIKLKESFNDSDYKNPNDYVFVDEITDVIFYSYTI